MQRWVQYVLLGGLTLPLFLAAAGCASPRDPINRVQPNYVDKQQFAGEWYYQRTVVDMLLGVPQRNFQGRALRLAATAHASDHFGELEGTGANDERLRRTLRALVEGGFLGYSERQRPGDGGTYNAVTITARGRDALAGGVELPEFHEPGSAGAAESAG